jgi:hypothetical protein
LLGRALCGFRYDGTERRRACVAIETEHRAEIADIEPAFNEVK